MPHKKSADRPPRSGTCGTTGANRRLRRARRRLSDPPVPPLLVAGAGGLGREVLDTALAAGRPVRGFLADGQGGAVVRGLPVREPKEAESAGAGCAYLVGIADPRVRQRLAALLDGAGLDAAVLVHPGALLAPEAELAPGALVLGGAYVSSSTRIGPHGQLHYNATLGHDSELGACATVLPGANISGNVRVGAGATVGSNAVVLQGRTVGEYAFVGAGAVVTRDVPPHTVVVGSPARPLRRAEP